MKIVIANSVGLNAGGERYIHFPSRWTTIEHPSWYDHSKGWMTFYPFALGYLSSLLKRDTDHEVKFLDGHLNNWGHEPYLKRIAEEDPDWLVMEVSSLSLADDMKLANAVREHCGSRLILAGQHPSAFPEEVLDMGADYVCVGEFEFTVLELLQGKDPAGIPGLFPNAGRALLDVNRLPWPEDADVRRIDYMEPCVSEYREIEMMASRGCPLTCTFCVATNVYYGGKPSWRYRDVGNVIREIRHLRDRYPEMEGIFFDDESHNGNKKFIMEMTRAMMEAGLNDLHYNAMCGYWSLDREALQAMKDAGYYKLRIGIETANEDIARGINKKTVDIPKLYSVLEAARDIGMKMYGTFLYGAPGSTRERDLETTRLVTDLLDRGLLFDLQHSICTPQPGTPFYRFLDEKGYLRTKDWGMYDGSRNVVFNYPDYPEKEIRDVVRHSGELANLHRGPVRFRDANFKDLSAELRRIRPRKVLLIRSGPVWLMNGVLKSIRENSEEARIHVIAQPQVLPLLKTHPGIGEIYVHNHAVFEEENFNNGLLEWMQGLEADLVLVLYNHNSDDRRDYRHVEALAGRSKAPACLGVDISGRVIRVT